MQRKILITLAILLIFTGIVTATLDPPENITAPRITNQDFVLEWSEVTGAGCYRIYEDGVPIRDEESTSYLIEIQDLEDKDYAYTLKATSHSTCHVGLGDESDPINVIVDTTPPSLPSGSKSPSPGEVNVDPSRSIVMEFDEENKVNKPASEDSFSITPSVGGNFSWSGKTLTFNPNEDLDYAKEYTVSINPVDEAGNTGSESWSVETSVLPNEIKIIDPNEGETFFIEEQITIRTKVTGEGEEAMLGGTVTATGAGNNEDLPEKNGGEYRTTSFKLQDSGEQTITIKAENMGHSITETVTISVGSLKPIGINILEPEETTFTRGEEIPFRIQPTVEGEPSEELELTSTILNLEQEDPKTYLGTLKTTYSSNENIAIPIRITGEVERPRDQTEHIHITLEPVTLNVNIGYLVDGEPTQTLRGGNDVRIQMQILYPNGELVGNAEVDAVLIRTREYEETHKVAFTHEGNGVYKSNELYTVSGNHRQYRTVVNNVEDPHGNRWSGEKTIEGPAGSLKFYITQPQEIGVEQIPLEASPGQTITIVGRVERQGETVVPDSIKLNGEELERDGELYRIQYKVPKADQDHVTLTFTLTEEALEYTQNQEIQLKPPTTNLEDPAIVEHGVTRGRKIEIKVTYPTGDAVADGSFTLEVGGETYQLEYNPDTGKWQTTEPVNLGNEEKVVSMSIAGQDTEGNEVTAFKAGINYNPSLGPIDILKNPLTITGIVTAIIVGLTLTWYHHNRLVPKKKLKKMYDELNKLFIEQDNVHRTFSKTRDVQKFKERNSEISGKQKSIRDQIVEHIKKNKFLRKKQLKKAKEVAERSIKKTLATYDEQGLSRRVWLTGLTTPETKELYEETKYKYAEKVNQMNKQKITQEEIKEKLKTEHDFNDNRATDIIRYAPKAEKPKKKKKPKKEQAEEMDRLEATLKQLHELGVPKERIKKELKEKSRKAGIKKERINKLLKTLDE